MEIRENIESYMRDLKAWITSTKDTPLEDMDAFFTRRLEGYEAHMLENWAEGYRYLASILPEGVETLLDLGCGTGLELDAIFRRSPGLRVTGIDLSQAMLEQLRRKHAGRQLRLLCGSYFEVPFPGPFDAVISFESLHHFTAAEKLPLFQKICRALTPGGVFINSDYYACCEEEETLLREVCDRRRQHAGIPAGHFIHFDTPLTPEHEMQVLYEAGFREVRLDHTVSGATTILAAK